MAIGTSDRINADCERSRRPMATAKSQPMAGFTPWAALSPARASSVPPSKAYVQRDMALLGDFGVK